MLLSSHRIPQALGTTFVCFQSIFISFFHQSLFCVFSINHYFTTSFFSVLQSEPPELRVEIDKNTRNPSKSIIPVHYRGHFFFFALCGLFLHFKSDASDYDSHLFPLSINVTVSVIGI